MLVFFEYNKSMIGRKLKELRKENGVKQNQIAKALGLSAQAISLWETDNADPDILNLKRLALFFNITIDELLEDLKI